MEKVTGYTKGKGIYSEYFEYKKFKLFEKHHVNLNSQCWSFLHSMAGADLMRNDEWYNKVKQDFQKALSFCETEEELSDFVQFMEDVANVGGYATEFYNENKHLISDKLNNLDNNKFSGWDAITNECDRVYPNQNNPKHYAPIIKYKFGGKDPLDGISVYDGGNYYHFVTYGLSELYEKKSNNMDISGYGMEFTFKLNKDNYLDEEKEIMGICNILQFIARLTFNNGEIFKPYEYLYTGQTEGIDYNKKSNITGFITIPDNNLKEIQTPNGRVCFTELIGVTDNELKAILNKQINVKDLYERLGTDITDYNRMSIV